MKIHLEIHDSRGVLFCGTVEARNALEALRLKLRELEMVKGSRFENLVADAKPVKEGKA